MKDSNPLSDIVISIPDISRYTIMNISIEVWMPRLKTGSLILNFSQTQLSIYKIGSILLPISKGCSQGLNETVHIHNSSVPNKKCSIHFTFYELY